MARVTVEDCVTKIPNRFRLVMMAAQRARNISAGAQLTMDRDNDKNPVVALREIADETIEFDELENALVKGLQRVNDDEDEPISEEIDFGATPQIGEGEGEPLDPAANPFAIGNVDANADADIVEPEGGDLPAGLAADSEEEID